MILALDEMHRIISGIVVAAEAEPDKRLRGAWREHCQKLGGRLEDPYLRIMLAHLAFDDWIAVVEEAAIPLRDRLNIALRFLDDGQVSLDFSSPGQVSYMLSSSSANFSRVSGKTLNGLATWKPSFLQVSQSQVCDYSNATWIALATFRRPLY